MWFLYFRKLPFFPEHIFRNISNVYFIFASEFHDFSSLVRYRCSHSCLYVLQEKRDFRDVPVSCHWGSLLKVFSALILDRFVDALFLFLLEACTPKGSPKHFQRRQVSNGRAPPGSVFRSETASGAFCIPFGVVFSSCYRFGNNLGSFLAPVWHQFSVRLQDFPGTNFRMDCS